jgi:hypothetical protein
MRLSKLWNKKMLTDLDDTRVIVRCYGKWKCYLLFGISQNLCSFEKKIGRSVQHVEAIYMFMVGRPPELEYKNCERERGIFPSVS